MIRKLKRQRKREMERENKFKQTAALVMEHGIALGSELMEKLSHFGSSREGLMIETYAMAMAYGGLRAMAELRGYDCTEMFDALLPSFQEEMKLVIGEEVINKHEKEN